MKPYQTQQKIWYCWMDALNPVITIVRPKNFESFELPDTVTAPNKKVAEIVYKANLRIKRGRNDG